MHKDENASENFRGVNNIGLTKKGLNAQGVRRKIVRERFSQAPRPSVTALSAPSLHSGPSLEFKSKTVLKINQVWFSKIYLKYTKNFDAKAPSLLLHCDQPH